MAAETGGDKKSPKSTKATPKKPAKRSTAATGRSVKSAAPAAAKPAKGTSTTARKPAAKSSKSPARPAKVTAAKASKATASKPVKVAASKPAKRAAAKKPSRAATAEPATAAASVGGQASRAAEVKDASGRAPAGRSVVEDTARRYFEATARRDAAAAVEVWDADGVDDVVPLGIYRGRAEIRAYLEEMFAAMPDIRLSVDRIVADDRAAAVQWRVTGTFTGSPFQGLESNGRRIDLRGVDNLEIEDGKIVHNTGMFDGAAFARQIGLLPPEDSGADRAIRAGFNTVTKLRRSVARRTAG
jgi:steroid delta-isomerase-like uncharacterized protein